MTRNATSFVTKLAPEVQDEIVGYLRAGSYQEVAARAAGVHGRTMRRWLQRGRIEAERVEDGAEPNPGEAAYLAFAIAADEAIAKAELALLAEVRKAQAGQWQKFMTIMERRWPDRWSLTNRQVVTIERNDGPAPTDVFGDGTPAEIAARANAATTN